MRSTWFTATILSATLVAWGAAAGAPAADDAPAASGRTKKATTKRGARVPAAVDAGTPADAGELSDGGDADGGTPDGGDADGGDASAGPVDAGPPLEATDGPPETRVARTAMRHQAAAMAELGPVAASWKRFSSPDSEPFISAQLAVLVQNAETLDPSYAASGAGLRIASKTMLQHLRRTQAAYGAGRREVARTLFLKTRQACLACHTLLPRTSTTWAGPAIETGDSVEAADEQVMLLRFEDALATYERVLAATAASGGRQREQVLRRALTIQVRARRDLAGAAALVDRAIALGGWTPAFADVLAAWKYVLSLPSVEPLADPGKGKYAEVADWARRFMEEVTPTTLPMGKEAMGALVTSGVLHRFLQENPASRGRGEPLYLLAEAERIAGDTLVFQTPELYMEACVREEPRGASAKRCLAELNRAVKQRYRETGDGKLPAEEVARLEEIEKLTR